jgi:Family of unknown function (DUF6085)
MSDERTEPLCPRCGWPTRNAHDDDHLIEISDDGWTIQHPLTERLGGSVFDCARARWTGGDPGVRGRFVFNADGTIGPEVTDP